MEPIVNLFNEIGMLAKTPRSGYAFLGSGSQSVAEHTHRMTLIAYALAKIGGESIDLSKLLMMCLLHDLPEARTGDLNYVNKRYVTANEHNAIEDIARDNPLGTDIADYIKEYIANKTLEAKMAHDADKLEMLLVLKEQHDIGNKRAQEWFETVAARLKTKLAITLAKTIWQTPSDNWWKT